MESGAGADEWCQGGDGTRVVAAESRGDRVRCPLKRVKPILVGKL